MSKQFFQSLAVVMSLGMLPEAVFAHTGVGAVHGFGAGFEHPFMGLDHLLTMLAVGVWAAALGGRALWFVPLSFVTVMAAGAGLQGFGWVLPSAEVTVALSVAVMGLILVVNWRVGYGFAGALAAAFALFHGYVHAEEIGRDMGAFHYAAGFLIATAVLHGLGMLLGASVGRLDLLRRALGAFCAGVGAYLLVGS
ncbi:HupE/UreJ family protein [Methylocaldum szegediense]|uniref:Protein HupE n=1 Tax=Methylocaldum szegediense TaxID=73780 RepID=A0ABN8XBK6_9GAMM|nr:HupE/UreJ family protein [Methylocaldum szegediense]CAI8915421.1 Protein HupE [Methylocaldum szegediense]